MAEAMSEHSSSATPPQSQLKITVAEPRTMMSLLGSNDEILRYLERALRADVHVRGDEITISGTPKDNSDAEKLFKELIAVVEKGETLTVDIARRTLGMLEKSVGGERPAEVLTLNILSRRGRTIRPKTVGQKNYVDAIDEHTIVFGIGPAGTGKTYLAMAKAVQALQAKQVSRIILTRPAVEAGERLGYLPGTLNEKIDPYLRPLYDALHDMVDPESIPRLMASGTIEVAPLAYMRGRAQPVDTKVLTPEGWRPIGELTVGDLVVGSNGEPTPVLGVYPQGVKETFRVTARDGASVLATGDHLWAVASDAEGEQVLTTAELAAEPGAYRLPLLSGAVRFPSKQVPTDAYAFALSLAVEAPVPLMPGAPPQTTLDFTPHGYLYNTPSVRHAFLQGLLDADGEADGPGLVRYKGASPRLREDVVFLARSLGAVTETDGDDLLVRLPEAFAPFRSARKSRGYTAGDAPVRHLASITAEGSAEAVCIQVAAADSLYVTEDFILTHNTLNDAFIILDEAQNTTPEQMKMFLTRLGFGSKVVVTGDVTQIDLPGAAVSGLKVVRDILADVEDVHFATLGSADVVRHRLVGDIVDAYAKWDATHRQEDDGDQGQHRQRRNDRRPQQRH
ncbi:hypothetical protein Afil01_41740 [Actinorhabdospora filicis]|uniref:PhoH-like protein n=1 Tax=Actinorhabdospora filicis TaxID=1785913 RepID=A0A9W6SP86_9ACTN|nr:hypothetical protein Afil01_41740 [Actinorhabdospora filicis]